MKNRLRSASSAGCSCGFWQRESTFTCIQAAAEAAAAWYSAAESVHSSYRCCEPTGTRTHGLAVVHLHWSCTWTQLPGMMQHINGRLATVQQAQGFKRDAGCMIMLPSSPDLPETGGAWHRTSAPLHLLGPLHDPSAVGHRMPSRSGSRVETPAPLQRGLHMHRVLTRAAKPLKTRLCSQYCNRM
jgi:hypothetical protein